MNAIRKYLDKIKPNFQKGGKLEYLHSTFDAFETFLFVPNKTTFSGSHIRDYMDMKRTMSMVVLALIPILLLECGTLVISTLLLIALSLVLGKYALWRP